MIFLFSLAESQLSPSLALISFNKVIRLGLCDDGVGVTGCVLLGFINELGGMSWDRIDVETSEDERGW